MKPNPELMKESGAPKQRNVPWYDWPQHRPAAGTRAVIVGAGIAGASAAYALAQRGMEAVVLEAAADVATQASGNPVAVILPVISVKPNHLSGFYLTAYRAVLAHIERLIAAGHAFEWRPTGVVHLPVKPRLGNRLEKLAEMRLPETVVRGLGADEVNDMTGLDLDSPALFYERGGCLDPKAFCRAHLAHPRIRVVRGARVRVLKRRDREWHLEDGAGACLARAETVILANGAGVIDFPQTAWLPVRAIRGQLAFVPVDQVTPRPRTIICHKGFMVPGVNGFHVLGATWNRHSQSRSLALADHLHLLEEAARYLPAFRLRCPAPLAGRVAFRAQCADRLPVVGPVPDVAGFLESYGDLHHGKTKTSFPSAPNLPGLYLSAGHGSRGMVSAHLCAELLASRLCGQTPALGNDLTQAVHPARFLIRQLKKHPRDRGIPYAP